MRRHRVLIVDRSGNPDVPIVPISLRRLAARQGAIRQERPINRHRDSDVPEGEESLHRHPEYCLAERFDSYAVAGSLESKWTNAVDTAARRS